MIDVAVDDNFSIGGIYARRSFWDWITAKPRRPKLLKCTGVFSNRIDTIAVDGDATMLSVARYLWIQSTGQSVTVYLPRAPVEPKDPS